MNKASEIDFLIVGHGLAGAAVALQALARHYNVLVLDDPSQNRSSLVAAGLFNPVSGRKMLKTWLADQIFPVLNRYYSDVERLTGKKFFYPMPLYRPFESVEEQNAWMAKSADSRYKGYIHSFSLPAHCVGKVRSPFGGIVLNQAGYLDTVTYLDAVRQYLDDRAAYQCGVFDPDRLEIHENHVRYAHIRARKVIFCQGVKNALNPWFENVPIKSLKGEVLVVQSDLEKDVILNRGVYMVPGAGTNEWRVGSTYNRNDLSPETTMQAREELMGKLDDLISVPYTVTGQRWGVRPTTPDRKPAIGAHPRHKSLVIFNGFGTKGVSLAPYFSEVLIRWVENKGTIDREADVTRFY